MFPHEGGAEEDLDEIKRSDSSSSDVLYGRRPSPLLVIL